jgi:hypothetical protein
MHGGFVWLHFLRYKGKMENLMYITPDLRSTITFWAGRSLLFTEFIFNNLNYI